MALVVYDRVQETTTTAGTGSLTLAGAVAGYQSFAVVGNGNTTYYAIIDGTAWEVGIGTYSTSGPTLARTTILSNSNGNTTAITLSSSSNTKQVFVTYPSEKSVNLDSSGNVTALGTIASGTWQGTTVGASYGGTGNSSYTTGDILYASGSTTLSKLGIGTNGYVLTSSGSGPQWTAATSVGVTSISFGSTGLTPSTATQGAVTVAGTLGIGYGGTGQTTASAAFNALSPITSTGDLIIGNGTNSATRLAIGANNYVLTSNGTTASWAAASSGVTISDDTSTNATRYPTFTSATSGSVSTENVSSTKLTYNPSTGALTSPEIVASNGLLVHSTTVSTSYSIPSGSNAIAAGPMTVAAGASVTIPSGSRWLVL